MKAIFFANGFRKRIVDESGGIEGLDELFDLFVDTSAFMKPWEVQRGFDDLLQHKKLTVLKNEGEIHNLLKKHGIEYVLIVGFDGSLNRKKVSEAINSAGAKYGILYIRKDFQKFLLRKSKTNIINSIKKTAKALLKNCLAKEPLPIPATHYFSNEPKAIGFPEVNTRTKKIIVNYRDYYLSINHQRPLSEKYVVFLDQAFPFHNIENHKIKGAPLFYDDQMTDQYYASLCAYLEKLSKYLGLFVVVCLHPNCPEKYRKFFPNHFKVVRHETGRYAKFAEVVVAHNSTSISLSYIYKRKSVSLALTGVMPEQRINNIRHQSKKLGTVFHNYPKDNISFDKISPPKNELIKTFLVPAPQSKCLLTEIKKHLKDL